MPSWAVGEAANQRLCDAQASDAQPAPDVVTLAEVTRPSVTSEGQHVPALRFGDARVMALMAAIVGFAHLITGFDNKTVTGLMTTLLDRFTKTYGRVLAPGLAAFDPALPADLAKRSPLATAWRTLNRELEHHIDRGIATA